MDKFNYAVGGYWDNSEYGVGCYACGQEVFYGTMQNAEDFLEYVKSKSHNKEWKIFKLEEVV